MLNVEKGSACWTPYTGVGLNRRRNMLCFETGKSSENECFTTFLSFKLFAISLQVVFNVILHEVTVSARTCREFRKTACLDF